MKNKDLYFVGLIPSEPVLGDVLEFKELCRDRFKSSRALRSPAHVTLVPPFRAGHDALNEITDIISNIASTSKAYSCTTDGFGRFQRKVVFVRPGESEETRTLYTQCTEALVNIGLIKQSERAFHPHMTIAFRDLSPDQFDLAWEYFRSKNYEESYEVKDIALLINGDSGWSVMQRFALGASE